MKTTTFFDNRMHLTEEGIALYVDALKLNKTEQLPSEMIHHVEFCMECKAEIMEVYDILKDEITALNDKHPFLDEETEMENDITGFHFVYRAAAVVTVFTLSGIMLYYLDSPKYSLRQTQQNTLISETQKDSVTLPQQNKNQSIIKELLFADNNTPSPNLEDLVQTEFRSVEIEVISPLNGATVEQPIQFCWKGNGGGVTLKILSNKEKVVSNVVVVGSVFDLKKKLAAGLYYWKLESKNELMYVGKFFVKEGSKN